MIQVSYFGSSCAVNGISGHSSIIFNLVGEEETDVDTDLAKADRVCDEMEEFTPKDETVTAPADRTKAV